MLPLVLVRLLEYRADAVVRGDCSGPEWNCHSDGQGACQEGCSQEGREEGRAARPTKNHQVRTSEHPLGRVVDRKMVVFLYPV